MLNDSASVLSIGFLVPVSLSQVICKAHKHLCWGLYPRGAFQFSLRWYLHITPLLEKLHWLPVEARIHYKIATLAFRHFENPLPPYLSELLHTYQPSQTLWSSSEKLLKVPQTNLKSAGNRSFHFQAAKIWISSFLKNQKTHLFKECFSLWFVKHLFCTV